MGKAARWLRGLLGGGGGGGESKKGSDEAKPKEKRRWGFGKSRRLPPEAENRRGSSYREEQPCASSDGGVGSAVVDPNKHAIAVAVATAAAAEAAVASAKAAAAVVRLTSSGRSVFMPASGARAEDKAAAAAAVKIQAAFRGYLARRALRALRGLVKLQALVRGHIERKNVAEKLRCMQAIVRVQARARAIRAHKLDSLHLSKASLSHPGPPTPEKHEIALRTGSARHQTRSSSLKRNNSKSRKACHTDMARSHSSRNWLDKWMDERFGILDDDKNAKILEVDPGKPHHNQKLAGRNFHQSSQSTVNSLSFTTLPDSPSKDSTTAQFSNPSPSSVEIQSLSPLRFPLEVDDSAFYTADNSPQFYSSLSRPGSARRGAFTPTKSDCSRGFLSGPNYMANTESSRAKARSHSAPKQRPPEFEKSVSTKRIAVHGIGDGVSVTSGCSQRSSLHAKFSSKAYPGSGRLDWLGMPIREVGGYNGASRYRY